MSLYISQQHSRIITNDASMTSVDRSPCWSPGAISRLRQSPNASGPQLWWWVHKEVQQSSHIWTPGVTMSTQRSTMVHSHLDPRCNDEYTKKYNSPLTSGPQLWRWVHKEVQQSTHIWTPGVTMSTQRSTTVHSHLDPRCDDEYTKKYNSPLTSSFFILFMELLLLIHHFMLAHYYTHSVTLTAFIHQWQRTVKLSTESLTQ